MILLAFLYVLFRIFVYNILTHHVTKIVEQKSQPLEAFKCKLVCWKVVNITIYQKQ
jgi:hypothetical protein